MLPHSLTNMVTPQVATLDATKIMTKNSLFAPVYNGKFDRNIYNKLESVLMLNWKNPTSLTLKY